MWPHTQRFDDLIRGEHFVVTQADILSGDDPIFDLTAAGVVLDGSVTVSRSDIQRSGTVTLLDRDGTLTPREIDDLLVPAGNQIRLQRGVLDSRQAPGGADTRELMPLITARFTTSRSNYPLIPLGGLFDRAWIVAGAKLENVLTIVKGTPYVDAISAILDAAYPGVPTNFPDSDEVTNAMTFDVESDPWQICQELAGNIGYRLNFDPLGVAVLTTDPDIDDPVAFEFDNLDPSQLLPGRNMALPGTELSWDGTGSNAVIVIAENTNLPAPIRAIARDLDPLSPTRYGGNYGKRPVWVRDEKIASLAQAQARANKELTALVGLSQSLSIPSMVHPAFEVGDVIRVQFGHSVDTADPPIRDSYHVLDQIQIPLRASGAMQLDTRARRVAVIE